MPPILQLRSIIMVVKMTPPNRPGQFKRFENADVDAAKKNGWTEADKPKPKKAKKVKD